MAIIYETEQIYTGGFINPAKLDPVKQYMKHYGNYLFLKFIFETTQDWRERRQANLELQIANKKMDRWYRLMTSEHIKDLIDQKAEMDKQWQTNPQNK